MPKGNAILAFASLFVAAVLVFATIELRRLGKAIEGLDSRIARVELPQGTDNPRADSGTGQPSSGSSSDAPVGSVAEEVSKLRGEIAALKSAVADAGAGSPPPDGASPRPHGNGGPAMSKDELSSAVQEAMRAKEKADKEKQEKATRKQTELGAKQWAKSLAGKLDLTEQQTQKLGEIFTEGWLKMSLGWQQAQEDENAEPYDYVALQKQMNDDAKAILTPEQATKYDEIMKKNNWWGGGESGESTEESSEGQR